MSLSDPLGDMLTRIRNAQRARHAMCVAPASKLRANVLDVLKREGYIRSFSAEQLRPGVAQFSFQIPLAKLAAGQYISQVSVIDETGHKFAFPRNEIVLLAAENKTASTEPVPQK